MLAVYDPFTRTWRCHLDGEPGDPVVIAGTLEEVVEFLRKLRERRTLCDSEKSTSHN